MNITGVKTPQARLDIVDLSGLAVKAYGKNNLYPQQLTQIIAASPSATLCARRMARFIEGRGFKDTNLYSYIVNRAGQTMDDVLKSISTDYASFGGFALSVNYNALGKIVELYNVPFENCRIGMDDQSGYTGKIAIHPDWSGKATRGGKALKVSKDTIDYIDVFNPLPIVVAAQIEAAGGIEHYKGQVLYVSSAGGMIYPTPVCDPIITEMSTEEGLGNICYRNARNNHLSSGMLIRQKGSDYTQESEEQFLADFGQFQGDTNSNKIIAVTIESNEVEPKFIPFDSANFDKEFDFSEKRTVEKIYAAFEQEKFYRVRSGSLYYSAAIAAIVNNDYSDTLISERQLVERIFTRIFGQWFEVVSTDFSIIPIFYELLQDDKAPDK